MAKSENIRAKAREIYCNDDLQIDDNALLSWGNDGVWVQAWVWIAEDDE